MKKIKIKVDRMPETQSECLFAYGERNCVFQPAAICGLDKDYYTSEDRECPYLDGYNIKR